MPNKECPGLKPPETDLCVEKPSCSGDSQVLADSVSLILSHEKENLILIVQVNIVGETLQSIDGPEMLPLIADQSEKEASYNHHLIEKPLKSSSSLNTQAFITSLKSL